MDWVKLVDWVQLAEVILILVVAVLLVVFTWKLHGWAQEVTLWSADVTRWSEEVDKDRKVFKRFMERIDRKIEEIFKRLPPQEATAGSPLRLTDFGEGISQDISAEQWADKLIRSGQLEKEVEGMSE